MTPRRGREKEPTSLRDTESGGNSVRCSPVFQGQDGALSSPVGAEGLHRPQAHPCPTPAHCYEGSLGSAVTEAGREDHPSCPHSRGHMLGTALPGFRSCNPSWLRLSQRPWDHKPLRRQSLSPWQGRHLCPLYFTLLGPEPDLLAIMGKIPQGRDRGVGMVTKKAHREGLGGL